MVGLGIVSKVRSRHGCAGRSQIISCFLVRLVAETDVGVIYIAEKGCHRSC